MSPIASLIVSLFCGIIGMVFGFFWGIHVEQSRPERAEKPGEAKP